MHALSLRHNDSFADYDNLSQALAPLLHVPRGFSRNNLTGNDRKCVHIRLVIRIHRRVTEDLRRHPELSCGVKSRLISSFLHFAYTLINPTDNWKTENDYSLWKT
uniref:Uncharacterized protein n=1 Tax=Pristionchus pacificus TaxID=54126 RepID=A0A2A6C2A5_PRIPA|eukprot:PDM72305.1 hypothetical protein PRIPAC_38739 [Pristionchus pacificus]